MGHNHVRTAMSPIIYTMIGRMAENLDDDRNTLVRPMLPSILPHIMTAVFEPDSVEQQRRLLTLDWLFRRNIAAWMNLAGHRDQANALRQLPSVQPRQPLHQLLDSGMLVSEKAQFNNLDWARDQAASDAVAEPGFHSVHTAAVQTVANKLPELALQSASQPINNGRDTSPTIQNLQQSWAELVLRLAEITDQTSNKIN